MKPCRKPTPGVQMPIRRRISTALFLIVLCLPILAAACGQKEEKAVPEVIRPVKVVTVAGGFVVVTGGFVVIGGFVFTGSPTGVVGSSSTDSIDAGVSSAVV